MPKDFNEDSRVKIPALIHLTRLGYKYISARDLLKNNEEWEKSQALNVWDFDIQTNIIKKIFREQFFKLNKMSDTNPSDLSEFEREFTNIQIELNQPDLGRSFYNRLMGKGNSNYKIIDWDNFNNNTFHATTELTYKNGDDSFRPDITIFINGLPLSFAEVKKPNNNEGIKAERDRMNDRMRNEKFRKFLNITQFMIFSNNEEYDDNAIGEEQLAGAFYATICKGDIRFNNFREIEAGALSDKLEPFREEVEDLILKDTNYTIIKNNDEFKGNKEPSRPTNRILTSFFTKSRLKFWLRYALVYVEETNKDGTIELQKHIMRYPQFFATKAIRERLESGVKKGIIWHTQGSGKTALSYYNFRYLRDYFGRRNIPTKFYFIVDRLDLLKQAKNEYVKRGAEVNTIDNKDALIKDMQDSTASNKMTIVNIQKFSEDASVIKGSYNDMNVQRIFFIDEAHRSYDPKGSFLANLYNADQNSIKIALTGTPLIIYKKHEKGDDEGLNLMEREDAKTTKSIFGDYIHKYYYNDSIKDGFTVRLIREEIQTEYREKVNAVLKELEVELKKGLLKTKNVMAHERFVEPMLEYILDDFRSSRIRCGDKTIGGMVVCHSSEQARQMYRIFCEQQKEGIHDFTGSLILCNEGSKESRNDEIQAFKDGKTDLLFVCAMLLTGFDAPRLKKLYLGRQIKAHTLLQALTRVNRPYHHFSFGYVVDFADISEQFEITNQAYLRELNEEYAGRDDGSNVDFSSLFLSEQEIKDGIKNIENALINYDTENKENFVKEISNQATTKDELTKLKKAIEQARDLYNIARLTGKKDLVNKLDIKLLSTLLTCVTDRIRRINQQEALSDIDSTQLLNLAMENSVFSFSKVGEEQLSLAADDLDEQISKVAHALTEHRFEKDTEWISFMDQYRLILQKIKAENMDMEGFTREKNSLMKLFKEITFYNSIYSRLTDKFRGDRKYAYIYKRIIGGGDIGRDAQTIALYKAFLNVKDTIDDKLLHMEGMLKTKPFFTNEVGVCLYNEFKQMGYDCTTSQLTKIRDELVDEYMLG